MCTCNLAGFPYIIYQNALHLCCVRVWMSFVCQLRRCEKPKPDVCPKYDSYFCAVMSSFQVNTKQFCTLLLCDGHTAYSEGLHYTVHQIPSKFYSFLHLRVIIQFSHVSFLSILGSKWQKCYPVLWFATFGRISLQDFFSSFVLHIKSSRIVVSCFTSLWSERNTRLGLWRLCLIQH